MAESSNQKKKQSPRDAFLSQSLSSTRKSYYLQLKNQLEEAKANEYKLQLLIDNLPARISYLNQKEEFVLVNKTYEQAFNLPKEEFIGKSLQQIIGQSNYNTIKPLVEQALFGEQVSIEISFIDPDKRKRWLEINYVPVLDDKKLVQGFYELTLDHTEKKEVEVRQKELEKKLQDIQRFQAIGTLAGGLAHDFNNLMTGVLGRASLMLSRMDPQDHMREHVQAIEVYIESATHLTQQLLGFARKGQYEVKPTEINNLLKKSIELFGRTNKEINLTQKYDTSNPVVEVESKQIEQVILNMLLNSKQAFDKKGGTIYVETKITFLDETFCAPYELSSSDYVKITVSDNGCGMEEEVRRQVFDPFFTTKAKQRGTGLGLASAYGIIKNHDGIITVSSKPGKGSSFTIYLPLSEKTVKKTSELRPSAVKGTGTILLVDDEEFILEVGQALLKPLGYKVITANGGFQAIDALHSSNGKVDLVILDIVMPDLDGGKTYSLIQDKYPGMKVLLSSGYSIDGQAQDLLHRGCNGFIQKPFSLEELSQAIQQILFQ